MKKVFKRSLWALLLLLLAGGGLFLVILVANKRAKLDLTEKIQQAPPDVYAMLMAPDDESDETQSGRFNIAIENPDGGDLTEEEIQAQIKEQIEAQTKKQCDPRLAEQLVRAALPDELLPQLLAALVALPSDEAELSADLSVCSFTPEPVRDWQELLPLFIEAEQKMLPTSRYPDFVDEDGRSLISCYKVVELKIWENAASGDAVVRVVLSAGQWFLACNRTFFFVGNRETGRLQAVPHDFVQNLSPIFAR